MDSKMENPFACASCKKSFSLPKALHNHVEFYHRSNPLPVTEVSENMEGRNQSENENCNIGKSLSVRTNHDASRFNSSVQGFPPNNLKNTGKDLVQLWLECLVYVLCMYDWAVYHIIFTIGTYNQSSLNFWTNQQSFLSKTNNRRHSLQFHSLSRIYKVRVV